MKLRIREMRYDQGWTQAELAERAGVAVATIKKLESPRVKRPHPHTLKAIADVFGVRPTELIVID